MPKEKQKLKVEVVNPKSDKEWEKTIDRINKFLELKYTKKIQSQAMNQHHL